MKKGFTLIEIILCIALISVISTISIVCFIKDDKDKEYNKIITEVVSAADVYFSSNNNLSEKINNNYGYLVLTLNELNSVGMIDENNIIDKFSNIGKYYEDNPNSYEKMVLIDESLAYGTESTLRILYPYQENDKKIYANLNPITIEYHEKDNFNCDFGISNLKYLDKDYNLKNVSESSCDDTTIKNVSEGGIYSINYTLTDEDGEAETTERSITINHEYTPNIYVIFEDGNMVSYEMLDNNYYNKKLKKISNETINQLEAKENLDIDRSIIKINNIEHDWKITDFSEMTDGKYELDFVLKLKGIIDNNNIKTINIYSSFIIDTIAPTIDISNLNEVKFSDSGSGVDKYVYSNEALTPSELDAKWVNYNDNIKIDVSNVMKDHYIYVKDKAGNTNSESIINSSSPVLVVAPVENSISNFTITLTSPIPYEKINLKWKYQYSDAKSISITKEDLKNANTINNDNKYVYTKEINMTDLYLDCYGDRNGCRKNSNPTIKNLNLKFTLEVSTENINRTYEIDATQNLYIENNHYFSTNFNTFYINDNNDIIYGFTAKPLKRNGYDGGSYGIYKYSDFSKSYLGPSNNIISSIDHSEDGENFYLIAFNNKYVEYAIYGDSPLYKAGVSGIYKHQYYYERYKYTISTEEKELIEEKSEQTQLVTKQIKQGSIMQTGNSLNLKADFKNTIHRFLDPWKNWEDYDGEAYYINTGVPDLFKNKMFVINQNDKTYYTTMVLFKQDKSSSGENKNKYARAVFYPEVTLKVSIK